MERVSLGKLGEVNNGGLCPEAFCGMIPMQGEVHGTICKDKEVIGGGASWPQLFQCADVAIYGLC